MRVGNEGYALHKEELPVRLFYSIFVLAVKGYSVLDRQLVGRKHGMHIEFW